MQFTLEYESPADARLRVCAVEYALCDEYCSYFHIMLIGTTKYAQALRHCQSDVVSLIMSNRVPLLCDAVAERIAKMDAARTIICICFLRHLKKTWFGADEKTANGIERLNDRLAGRAKQLETERENASSAT